MGRILLLLLAAGFAAADAPTFDELLQAGRKAFYESEDMAAAERLFREALARADATAEQKEEAHFWVCASVGRQVRYADAAAEQARFLEAYPESKRRHYVLYFQGDYLQRLGRADGARACWETIVREAPESDLAAHARRNLREIPEHYRPGRVLRGGAGAKGDTLVVEVYLARREGFRAVAKEVAAFHGARTVAVTADDLAPLRKVLAERLPERVILVVPPDVLDRNLHRRVLLLSAGLDDDPFPDFAFGYLTARDAAALRSLWERTQKVRADGLASKRWISTCVSGNGSRVQRGSVPAAAKAAGFTGDQWSWALQEQDPETLAFAKRNLAALEEAGVVTMTGCGDPQGVWLFSDRRNADREKHWDYEPGKVGRDPDGTMPRITAAIFRALELKAPVVWTGVCHQGATGRVWVEGDIVSTFGRAEKPTVYAMGPDESVCLAVLDAGAVAYLCPIAANHGASVARETDFALETGAPLGEVIKSTYDDVWLQARGELVLDLPEEGRPHADTEAVMQGGGANRILIGDPSLAPFTATPNPEERVEIANRREDGFDVVVTWAAGYRPRGWDMFGTDRTRDWTIRARVDLAGLVPADRDVALDVSVAGTGEKGEALPYAMTHGEPESFHGRRYLHLQANAPRDAVAYKAVRAVFRVTWRAAP